MLFYIQASPKWLTVETILESDQVIHVHNKFRKWHTATAHNALLSVWHGRFENNQAIKRDERDGHRQSWHELELENFIFQGL